MATETHATWAEQLTTVDLALRVNHAAASLACAAHRGDSDLVTIRLVELVRAARAIGTQYDIRLIEDFDALEDAMRHELSTEPLR